MPHRDTAFMSLSLDGVETLSIRIVKTTGHGYGTLIRKVWALVVLTHISSLRSYSASLSNTSLCLSINFLIASLAIFEFLIEM